MSKTAFETQHPMLLFAIRTLQGTLFSTATKIAYKLNAHAIDYLAKKGTDVIEKIVIGLFNNVKSNEDSTPCIETSEAHTPNQLMIGLINPSNEPTEL